MALGSQKTISTKWVVIKEETLSSDVTSYTFSNLNLAVDKWYRLFFHIKNIYGSAQPISFFFNSESSNNKAMYINANNTTITSARDSDGVLGSPNSNETIGGTIDICNDVNGYPRAICRMWVHDGANIQLRDVNRVRTSTTAITSLQFLHTQANSIGTGSYFCLCKLRG